MMMKKIFLAIASVALMSNSNVWAIGGGPFDNGETGEPFAARLSSQGRASEMPVVRRKWRRVFIRGKRLLGPKKTKRGRNNGISFGFFGFLLFLSEFYIHEHTHQISRL